MKLLNHAQALLAIVALTTLAAEKEQPQINSLTPEEVADGWILLFDGETTRGWKTQGPVHVRQGSLVLSGPTEASVRTLLEFGSDFEVKFEFRNPSQGALVMAGVTRKGDWRHKCSLERTKEEWGQGSITVSYDMAKKRYSSKIASRAKASGGSGKVGSAGERSKRGIGFEAPGGTTLELRRIRLKPVGLRRIFNGKDLSGWKAIKGDGASWRFKSKSQCIVTKNGWLNIKNGPGDLQTEDQWDDFVLQLDCISNGARRESGVFFRCIPGKLWSGYKVQLRNQWDGNDRTKPVDYGTGGIYNRQSARKVVSTDREWFSVTVIAQEKRLAVWINGSQTADFTDSRPIGKDARENCKVEKGPISLQGHDAETDFSFRNIRIGDLP